LQKEFGRTRLFRQGREAFLQKSRETEILNLVTHLPEEATNGAIKL